jgi:hypothetical protein
MNEDEEEEEEEDLSPKYLTLNDFNEFVKEP